jgi:hypothetical protein
VQNFRQENDGCEYQKLPENRENRSEMLRSRHCELSVNFLAAKTPIPETITATQSQPNQSELITQTQLQITPKPSDLKNEIYGN